MWKWLKGLFGHKTQVVEQEVREPQIPVIFIYPDPTYERARKFREESQFLRDMRKEWELEQRRNQWKVWVENNKRVFAAA